LHQCNCGSRGVHEKEMANLRTRPQDLSLWPSASVRTIYVGCSNPFICPFPSMTCDPIVSSRGCRKSLPPPVGFSSRAYTISSYPRSHHQFISQESLLFLDMLPNRADLRVPLNNAKASESFRTTQAPKCLGNRGLFPTQSCRFCCPN
jgi:hypothetical protein